MQDSGTITTATSGDEGRLKISTGCSHGKKKCLKCTVGKYMKDGKGGPGMINAPGYGMTKAQTTITPKMSAMTSKPHRSSRLIGGTKMKGMKTMSSTINSLNKKMKFGKTLKNTGKSKSLKSMLKGVI